MVTYIIRRFFVVVLALALFIQATFFLVQAIPGGPYETCCDSPPPPVREHMENDYGINHPPTEQFFY